MKKILLCLFCGLSIVNLTGCMSDASTSNDGSGSDVNNQVKKSYGLNEDVYITNSNGEYSLRITGIKETSDRNQFSDKVANRVIIISYEYENISLNDDLYISSLDFKVYDKDNNILDTYPVTTEYPTSIGTGRKAKASEAYALNISDNYIELEFYDNMFNSNSDCVFKLNW